MRHRSQPQSHPIRSEPRWGRRTAAAGLAASALALSGCTPHETADDTSSYWHFDHEPSVDEQRIGDDIRHAIEDEHAPGDEDYNRAVAKYGPYQQQPDETDAAWCNRSKRMFAEIGAEYITDCSTFSATRTPRRDR